MIDPTLGRWHKGVPRAESDRPLSDVGNRGYCVLDDQLMLPAAILKASALEQNARWMAAFLDRSGLSFAPHGKTTMSPEIIQRQLDDGAWAITAATAHHVRAYAAFGVRRILLANQLVGAANIAAVLATLRDTPELEFHCLVDSIDGVRMLADAAREHGQTAPVNVLLEIGGPGQRTGVMSAERALGVARECAAHRDTVSLRGVEAFEGVYDEAGPAVALLSHLAEIVSLLDREALFGPGEVIVTAGGTAFFDIAARALVEAASDGPVRLVHRSGCYVTHDSGHYEATYQAALVRDPELSAFGRPAAALEVWAHVQSRPEPHRVVASLGKRDVGIDVQLPTPLWHSRPGPNRRARAISGVTVERIFDQHICLAVPSDSDFRVGDLIGFGVSHPCTTFDRWRALFVVDDDYRVVDVVRTFF